MTFLRAPIDLAMLLCGFGGWYFAMNGNPVPLLAKLKSETYTTFSSYSLSIIPLFLLMWPFAALSGMSQALLRPLKVFWGTDVVGYHGRRRCLRWLWGDLRMFPGRGSNNVAPGLARTVPIRLFRGFFTATLAADGTPDILIPPSVILVI